MLETHRVFRKLKKYGFRPVKQSKNPDIDYDVTRWDIYDLRGELSETDDPVGVYEKWFRREANFNFIIVNSKDEKTRAVFKDIAKKEKIQFADHSA
jgi:hypothetical protein